MKRKMLVRLIALWLGVVLVPCFGTIPGAVAQDAAPSGALAAPRTTSAAVRPLGVQFAHMATSDNIVGSNTFIRHYATDGQPSALLFVTPDVQPGGIGAYVYDPHPVGVWYSNAEGRWEIYNQDLFAMPPGATFHVLVATAGPNAFLHTATAGNIAGDTTYIDSPLTNNQPNAMIVVTPNWSPGGGSGINNPHLIGAWYGGGVQKWGISNLDGSPIPAGAAFNVLVLPTDRPAFVQRSTASNVYYTSTYLDHPALNGHPNAIPFITQNTRPAGGLPQVDDHPTGVWYDTARGKWAVVNLDYADMPVDVAFNVLVPAVEGAAFVHYASESNTWANYTLLGHPLADSQPNAILFTAPNSNPGGGGAGTSHNHATGVWYADYAERWSIFNQDSAAMPPGTAFNVLIPVPDAGVFVHQATADNTTAQYSYLNHPLTNGRREAILIVTPNWNPGGVTGVYDNHPVGVWFDDAGRGAWAVYNLDWEAMPAGAAFNVLVAPSGPASGSTAFVHQATLGNISGHVTFIDHPATNNRPSALVFATFNYNPPGSPGTGSPYLIGVSYDRSAHKWAIFNQDFSPMIVGTAFNVLVTGNNVQLPLVVRQPR